MYDGYYTSDYKDDFFTISSYSGTGIGRCSTPSYCVVVLSNGECVYSDRKPKKCELWYDHLVEVYNKTIEVKTRRYNLNYRITELFKYVPTGYDDGVIHVEYERSFSTYHSYSEEEDICTPIYTCSIYLIPAGEYVYVRDQIYHKKEAISREGQWVDYVCSLIDRLKQEEINKRELENKRRRDLEELKRLARLLREQQNNRPIDDSYIFDKKMR